MTILFFLTMSCTSDNVDGGAKGIINFGEGDCSLDYTFRFYSKYTGYAYCIEQSVNDSLQNIYNVYPYCDSVFCSNGKYNFALEPGIYYIFIREYPFRSDENKITVHYKSIAETEFFFYRCI
ncbi:MAG: hypothetical protein KBB11_11035 [Bacteroidales bacterium]|nr:hypothetical protein [Bacteroidales bacterium]HOY38339.1 hypothetical protein [Bacteroidales bacterium]HQP03434.1 hypothetical protein [Bacteroidales bacterium]